MKRSVSLIVSALTMLVLFSCQKQQLGSFTCNITSRVEVDYDNQQTVVYFRSVFDQKGATETPSGNALLIYSPSRDMNACETLSISGYKFNSSDEALFTIPAADRPFDVAYWYIIELQTPLSQPLRSEVFQIQAGSIIGPDVPEKVFVLSNGDYIQFATGNLQYNAVSGTWRFADNQYDVIGTDNQNVSSSYNGYVDLFGYGTSGYRYNPFSSVLDSIYYATGDINGTSHDWGVHCNISNGGSYQWRTPLSSEWDYIYSNRPDAAKRRSRATVNDMKGLVLLPDVWNLPSGSRFTPDAASYSTNTYTADQWQTMENAGAVFLPAAGYRIATAVYGLTEGEGNYHSASWVVAGTSAGGSSYCAQPLRFVFNDKEVYSHAIYSGTDAYSAYGSAVRLVRDVDKE